MYEQISLFDYLRTQKGEQIERTSQQPLQPGTKIGRVILGEVEEAIITKVEGNKNYFFYRTENGICFSKEEARTDFEQLYKEAQKNRSNYQTIDNYPLERRVTIAYAPRTCDQRVLYAQVGIFQSMLYWKRETTYEFLEPLQGKNLEKEYEKKLKSMTIELFTGKQREYTLLSEQLPMTRLYWSKHGFFASANYVNTNR